MGSIAGALGGAVVGGAGAGLSSAATHTGQKLKTFNRYGKRGPREKHLAGRGEAALNEEQQAVESGLGLGGQLTPEMMKELGFDPQYADVSQELAAAGDKVKGLQGQLSMIRQINASKGADRKALVQQYRQTYGSAPAGAQARVQKQLDQAQTDYGNVQANGARVTGFKRSEGGGDAASLAGINDTERHQIAAALAGNGPADPTVAHQLQIEEQQLNDTLRRNLGEDFATSTPGQMALSEFAKRKAETIYESNQNLIGRLNDAATSNSNQTSARLNQLAFPANTRINQGLGLSDVAKGTLGYLDYYQRGREQAGIGLNNGANTGEAVAGGILTGLGGAVSGGALKGIGG